ncbi:MAG: efflux RND transporter periplasmic adaptor subunit [Bryobacteraceae bacterium]
MAGLGAGAWYLRWNAAQPSTGGPGGPGPVIRMTQVSTGHVERTIRLTGSTGATNFASVLTPMMRGSRSGFGRTGPQGSFSVQQRGSSVGGSRSGGSSMMMAMGGGGDRGGGDRGGGDRGGGDRGDRGGDSGASTSATSGTAVTIRSTSSASSASRSTARTPVASASSSSSGSGSGGGGSSGGGGGGGMSGGGMSGGGGDRGGGEFQMTVQNLVKPGSRVAKGDIVAQFDDQYMRSRLDDYRASVIQTEMSYKKMLADLEVSRRAHELSIASAKADLDKAQLDLKMTSVVSNINAERLRLAAEEAAARYKQLLQEVQHVRVSEAADLRVADLELQQSRLELKRAEANAERMVLRAPIEGMAVMENNVRGGGEFEQIKEGDQLFPGQPLMKVVDLSSIMVNAVVNQVDAEKIRIGQPARVRFDAFPGLDLPARVLAIAAVPRSSRMRGDWLKEIPVTLKLEKLDARVIPDLSVSVDVLVQTEQSVSSVPRESLFYDAEGAYVYVKNGSKWEKRRVETGVASYTTVTIRRGLNSGDQVALEPPPANGRRKTEVAENRGNHVQGR